MTAAATKLIDMAVVNASRAVWTSPLSPVRAATSNASWIDRRAWIASVLGQVGLPYLGPNVMRLNDRMLALFEAGGFPPDEAGQALSTVAAYVTGISLT